MQYRYQHDNQIELTAEKRKCQNNALVVKRDDYIEIYSFPVLYS